ncbi:unnamed protein product [Protopolystoma xenopodis]|uniref:Uncharacterized protein n=1 Tax=Protopolystoma xenopodis TaxID=117903 RepID=A0A3S5ASE9_9PLAT|nr:unnamed protein product [Protopolystoma xenopodis]
MLFATLFYIHERKGISNFALEATLRDLVAGIDEAFDIEFNLNQRDQEDHHTPCIVEANLDPVDTGDILDNADNATTVTFATTASSDIEVISYCASTNEAESYAFCPSGNENTGSCGFGYVGFSDSVAAEAINPFIAEMASTNSLGNTSAGQALQVGRDSSNSVNSLARVRGWSIGRGYTSTLTAENNESLSMLPSPRETDSGEHGEKR